MLQAELSWLQGVSAEIRGGRLTRDEDWIREVGAKFNPTTEERRPVGKTVPAIRNGRGSCGQRGPPFVSPQGGIRSAPSACRR